LDDAEVNKTTVLYRRSLGHFGGLAMDFPPSIVVQLLHGCAANIVVKKNMPKKNYRWTGTEIKSIILRSAWLRNAI
jgi:hypothetical protein